MQLENVFGQFLRMFKCDGYTSQLKSVCFLIRGERVTCRRDTTNWTFDSHVSRFCFLKLPQICGVKQTISSHFFYFWVLRFNKTLNDSSRGERWFMFPSTSMSPSASPRGTFRVSGPVIKCLLLYLATQRRFPFEGERVKSRESKPGT